MKLKQLYILLSLLFVSSITLAQTLQRGRELFLQEDYSGAKPIMLKFLKQKPDDASRNYWYGVCCYETGEQNKSITYLEKAAEKNIVKAYRYIGDYYFQRESYSLAIENYESFISGMKADSELHNTKTESFYTHRVDSLKALYRMIRSTQIVCFIDSFLINKKELRNYYMVDESVGSFYKYADFFDSPGEGEVFLPEMGTNVIFSRREQDGIFRLYERFKSFENWVDEAPLKGLEAPGNLRYPFMENDGVTIYYAADGPESLGGLDIFVSRRNSSTGSFLVPENMGMPFNSEANDYLYVIDEVNNLGWFATDRRQPEDTVCVYVFVPNSSRTLYNYEGGDTAAIHRAARIISIKESQTDLDLVRTARQKLTLLAFSQTEEQEKGSFLFVIDDLTDYHELSDFKNREAHDMFIKWNQMKEKYAVDSERLENQRQAYQEASKPEKDRMSQSLLELETEVMTLEREIREMEINIRNTEIKFLQR